MNRPSQVVRFLAWDPTTRSHRWAQVRIIDGDGFTTPFTAASSQDVVDSIEENRRDHARMLEKIEHLEKLFEELGISVAAIRETIGENVEKTIKPLADKAHSLDQQLNNPDPDAFTWRDMQRHHADLEQEKQDRKRTELILKVAMGALGTGLASLSGYLALF